jgi:hypothetical protein
MRRNAKCGTDVHKQEPEYGSMERIVPKIDSLFFQIPITTRNFSTQQTLLT